MQKTAQAWFTGGPSTANSNDHQQKPSSLLADWNSYAASQESDSSAFDLEAAVCTTTDKVSGTFSVVSKGVKELPGSFQSATSNVPSAKSLMYFSLLLAVGVFFIFIAFTMFLPIIVLVPQKFAICFTVGCALIVGSFFALKGPKTQLAHMFSKERLPFTLGSIGSMVGTIYVSMMLHSYFLSVLFSVFQVVALSYHAISYFPGESFGLKFMYSSLTSSILRCFGRYGILLPNCLEYILWVSGPNHSTPYKGLSLVGFIYAIVSFSFLQNVVPRFIFSVALSARTEIL